MRMDDDAWSAYRPSDAEPWDLARAWTLRRRAGFGATWRELERDLADGPDAAVGRVLAGECRVDGLPADFAATADLLGSAAAGSGDVRRLQAWWLYRCLFTPAPLAERLTLAWHDHFATSRRKVEDLGAMHAQNETLRRLGRGPFGELLHAMLLDPALLAWLDAPANRKGNPNENLAREFLELFTLGVGHYAEADVKESARALTGLRVTRRKVELRASDHDDGPKTILGETAPFDPDALADLVLKRPETAGRLARRLCVTFLGEGVADDSAVAALASRLRDDGLHVGRATETILRSRLFFGRANLHAKVSDPVGFVVGSIRAFEAFAPRPPSTLLLAEWTSRMGQELFQPPNVGGWPGGRAWLSGRAVVARSNFAAALGQGRLRGETSPPDLAAIAGRMGAAADDPAARLEALARVATGRGLDRATADAMLAASAADGDAPARLARAAAVMLSRPESQLC